MVARALFVADDLMPLQDCLLARQQQRAQCRGLCVLPGGQIVVREISIILKPDFFQAKPGSKIVQLLVSVREQMGAMVPTPFFVWHTGQQGVYVNAHLKFECFEHQSPGRVSGQQAK